MGTVVTVMNMKGGVGKTTVTLNLGGILTRYHVGGKKPLNILLIDYDPQFNLSQAYLESKQYFEIEKKRLTTLAILTDDATSVEPFTLQVPGNLTPPSVAQLATSIYSPSSRGGLRGRLDIIPSTLNLMYLALGQANTKTKPIEERFSKFVDEAKRCYDLVLIDCHPAGSLFTKTSLTNSDFVLIPVVPQQYAVRGIGLMMEFMKAKEASSRAPKPIILFNSTSRTGIVETEASIRSDAKYSEYCLPSTLKYFKAFAEPDEGRNFVWQSKKPYSHVAFLNLMSVARDFRERTGT